MRALFLVAFLAGTAAAQPGSETTVEVVKPKPPPEPKQPDAPVPPANATAATPAAPPVDPFDEFSGANALARGLFVEARKFASSGNLKEACSSYADSYAREETVNAMFYLGTCRETDGKNAEAWRLYQQVATHSDRDGNSERSRIARERAAALEPKLATLVIRFAKPIMDGTVVNIDGRPLDMSPEIREKVDPGQVLVTAKGPTGVTSSAMVSVPVRNTVNLEVPSLRDQGTYRRRTWIVASGILVLGGIIAIGTRNGYAALAGAGAIAGGVAVFLLAPRERVMVVPMTVGASGGGVALAGHF